jgi:hypothetical protein
MLQQLLINSLQSIGVIEYCHVAMGFVGMGKVQSSLWTSSAYTVVWFFQFLNHPSPGCFNAIQLPANTVQN